MILKLKFFLLNINFVKLVLAKAYTLILRDVKIFKKDNYWIHKKKRKYLLNFHPVLNFEKFEGVYKFFTKNYKPQKGHVIFDVGSGLGQELLYLSKSVGKKGKIFSIESDPRLFKVLKQLVDLNKLENVYLFNAFFHNKNGIYIKSNLLPLHDWMSNSINKSSEITFKLKTVTIDNIIKKYNIKKINFAKFNIEGSEINLRSGNNLFLKKCDNICISCHDFLTKKNYHTFKKIKYLLIKKKFEILKNTSNHKIIKYFIYGKKKN